MQYIVYRIFTLVPKVHVRANRTACVRTYKFINMNDIIYSKNKSKRLSLNEHNLRSQSELIFNNFSILPRSKKHSVSRRLSKQIAHAEALNLYHQLDLADGETEKNDVFLSESFSHCACDDILKSSLPSSYSSDASSATNSTGTLCF